MHLVPGAVDRVWGCYSTDSATAARQGGMVAASLVSSANIRLPHTRNLPAQRQPPHCPVHILTHR